MTEFLKIIISHWFEITVISGISFIGKIAWDIRCHYIANNKATMSLLQDRLNQAHKYFMRQPYIFLHDKRTVCELYDNYKNLGGNGVMDRMMVDIDEIPVRVYENKKG